MYVCLCVCVWPHMCWFSLSSCWLRRVGRNLLLASAASMSSISLLLSSRMAERMRRLSSRSTVPSSCATKTAQMINNSTNSAVIWISNICFAKTNNLPPIYVHDLRPQHYINRQIIMKRHGACFQGRMGQRVSYRFTSGTVQARFTLDFYYYLLPQGWQ